MHAIEVDSLTKVYPGGVRAVDGVSFSVPAGEIFGFLGPNGAGKSTTILMLTTLLRPTAGAARVAGFDVVRDPVAVRRSLGYVSQDLAVDDNLTGRENLWLQAQFYGLSAAQTRERIADVLGLVNLAERIDDRVETYSGGMRKRLDIAEGLIHRPRVLFLDEPTLGLDIQTRSEIWRYINRLRDEAGMTIFLTTHYMDEADRLCDRVAIIDRGRLMAIDAPATLKQGLGGDVITLAFAEAPPDPALAALRALPGVREVTTRGTETQVIVADGESAVPRCFDALHRHQARIASVMVKHATLDDVYLHYTGRGLRDEVEGSKEDAMRRRIAMRRSRR